METSLVQMENLAGQQPTGQIDNAINVSDKRRKNLRNSATRMAGFLFWANIAALLSLSIGCVSPGWLTVGNKDYSLWHVTRCDTLTGSDRDVYMIDKLRPCETLSYRLLEAMPVGTRLHKTLSYEDFLQGEVLYCVGMLLSLVTLCGWYKFRMNVAKDKCVDLSIKKWVLLFSLAAISAVVVIVPVGMFSRQKSTFSSLFTGIVFAGFGGALMSLIAVCILLHLLCYAVPDYDICLCTSL